MNTLAGEIIAVRTSVANPRENAIGGRANVRLAPYLMLALGLMGMVDAFYVAHASYTGQPLRELIIEGANTVLNSPHARIFGVPLSYLGLIYYSYMVGLAALLAFDPYSRGLRFGAVLYAAMGVASSIYFIYLQLGFIRAVCVYCIFSAVTTLLLSSPRSGTPERRGSRPCSS